MLGDRYFLHALVGVNGSVQHCDNIGWMEVGQIVTYRQWDDQYAVVETTSHEVQVWDLFDAGWLHRMYLDPPKVVATYEQVDQAIMATALVIGSGDA